MIAMTTLARFLFIGVVACGTRGDGTDGGVRDVTSNDAVTCNTTEPLSACASGWQFGPLPNQCPCGVSSKPECANGDCQELDVYGYLDGGVEIQGIIYYSAEAGTMSTWSPVLQGQWSLVDGGIVESLSGKTACATCDSAGGVCYGACDVGNYSTEIPASPGWSLSLNAAFAAGKSWTAWPVTP